LLEIVELRKAVEGTKLGVASGLGANELQDEEESLKTEERYFG
jgi:hypothetical protein